MNRFSNAKNKVDLQKVLEAAKAAQSEKLCLHPNASVAECSGGIIRAHTIRRSGDLKKIAKQGQVYVPTSKMGDLVRADGELTFRLSGIKDATTIWGFCNKHDTSIFSPIETAPITACPEHAFLLGYRAVCREYYAKLGQLGMIAIQRELNEKLPEPMRSIALKFTNTYAEGVALGHADLQNHKIEYDKALVAGDFSRTNYYAVWLDRPLEVLCTGSIFLEVDFDGIELYRASDFSDYGQVLDCCTVSSFASDSGGAFIISWQGTSAHNEQFVRSLHKIVDARCPDAIVRFLFEFFENIAVAPDWWDALGNGTRDALIKRLASGAQLAQRANNSLLDDGLTLTGAAVLRREFNLKL